MTSAPDWLTERPIAHRGLHDRAAGVPENSLAAFRAAIQAGYPIELDVRQSADGRAVVFHDRGLARTTGVDGRIGGTSAAELAELRLHDSDEGIPSLAEVLDLVAGRVPIIVEIKSEAYCPHRIEQRVLAALRGYRGDYVVSSFNGRTLSRLWAHAPEVPRGLNCGQVSRHMSGLPWRERWALRDVVDIHHGRPDFIVYDRRDLPCAPARRVRAAGLPLLSFTVRDDNEARRLAPHVDNIIFEGFRP